MDVAQQLQIAYPQAFSVLHKALHDWALAEDCLQDAVEKALHHWPLTMPDSPVAWLITTAKHKAIDHYRKTNRLDSSDEATAELESLAVEKDALADSIGDDMLRLIFCCCHPLLERETQLALTLKHVLSFSTRELASALLVSEKTMEQRLTRAKKRIDHMQLPFDLPSPKEIQTRLDAVLQVIYLIYNEGYSASSGRELLRSDLSQEAIRLTRWLHVLVRGKQDIPHAELLGLLALMISQQARAPARTRANGEMILLEEQDRSLWNKTLIQEAQVLTEKALRMGQVGPYQIQAAISALHNQATTFAKTDWPQIRLLYQALLRQQDTPVIRLNYGIVLARELGAEKGLAYILTLAESLKDYVPYFAALGALYLELNQTESAIDAYRQAIQLSDNERSTLYYQQQIAKLKNTG